MYCPSCGAKVDEGSRVCSACGCFVDQGPTPPQASPVMSEDAPVSSGEIREVPAASHGVRPDSRERVAQPAHVDRAHVSYLWDLQLVLHLHACKRYKIAFVQGNNEETPGLLRLHPAFHRHMRVLLVLVVLQIGNRMQANAPRYGLMFQEIRYHHSAMDDRRFAAVRLGALVAMFIIIKNSNALAAAYNARLVRA